MEKPRKLKPSDFTIFPWDSVKQSCKAETIALNVMKIMKRTGNEFRTLTFEEYEKESMKDGKFSSSEKALFEEVIDYCVSPETAKLFSKKWKEVIIY